ncbi:unnamed protein product, partial [Effrenium voratum]
VIGIAVLFALDLIFIVARVFSTEQPAGQKAADLTLLAGRIVGVSFLAAVAARLALGSWPWSSIPPAVQVTRALTRTLSGEDRRQAPLLDRDASGDARAQQLDSDVSSRQQQLKKMQQG